MKLLLDSSMLIFNFEFPHSNSRIIFDLALAKKIDATASEKALIEVSRVLSMKKEAPFVRLVQNVIQKNCTIVPISQIGKEMQQWRGKIKEKDLEHLATAKHVNADYIIAFDRDFEPFKEYRTPRRFVQEILKQPAFQTDY